MNDAGKFFIEEEEDKRLRLNYKAVKEHCPELAHRVLLIRTRAKELEKNFRVDANWALDWFNRLTLAGMAIALCAAIFGAIMTILDHSSFGGSVALAIGAIAALAAAGSQSFGWHKRFGAMFAARWAMTALVTRIDQQVLQIAMSIESSQSLPEKTIARLDGAIEEWIKEIGDIMKLFGTSYGAAVKPISIPRSQD